MADDEGQVYRFSYLVNGTISTTPGFPNKRINLEQDSAFSGMPLTYENKPSQITVAVSDTTLYLENNGIPTAGVYRFVVNGVVPASLGAYVWTFYITVVDTYTYTLYIKAGTGGSIVSPSSGYFKQSTDTSTSSYTFDLTASQYLITVSSDAGYDYTGYFTEDQAGSGTKYYPTTGSGLINTITVSANSSKTLYAQFKEYHRATVIEYRNQYSGDNASSIMYLSSTSYTPPANSWTYSGHTLLGMATSRTGSVVYETGKTYTLANESTTTLYCIWTTDTTYTTYSLSYSGMGTGMPAKQQAVSTASTYSFTVSSTIPFEKGYIFKGWSTTNGTYGVGKYHGGDVITLTSSSPTLILYAKWAISLAYTITFNALGGISSVASMTTNEDTGKLSNLPTATYSGRNFLGWALTSSDTTPNVTTNTVFSANTTVYAIYTEVLFHKYTITFDPNGGQVYPKTGTTTYGDVLATLPVPSYAGFIFNGWYLGDTLVTTATVYTANTTIVAHWTTNPNTTEQTEGILTVRPSNRPAIYSFRLDNITSIEETDSANLVEISTVIYGSEDNFVMDMGNSRKFDLDIVRNNPKIINNSSADDRDWDNATWFARLRAALDSWQNFFKDPETGASTGGFRFKLIPPTQYAELYPNHEENVFLAGSLSPRYSGQKLTLSLPLQVARMTAASASVTMVSFTFRLAAADSSDGQDHTEVIQYPLGSTIALPAYPSDWDALTSGKMFVYWMNGTTAYSPSQSYAVVTDQTFVSTWVTPTAGIIFASSSASAIKFGDNSAGLYNLDGTTITFPNTVGTLISFLAVGAGGSGGKTIVSRSALRTLASASVNAYWSITRGSGGGAGNLVGSTLSLAAGSEATVLKCTIGKGVINSAGESTVVRNVNLQRDILTAQGGYMGNNAGIGNRSESAWPINKAERAAKYVVSGASGYTDGVYQSSSMIAGENGQTGNSLGNGGAGGTSWSYYYITPGTGSNTYYHDLGGGGGAASELNITLNGVNYHSTGGNAEYTIEESVSGYPKLYGGTASISPAASGTLGGGAGGGAKEKMNNTGSQDVTNAATFTADSVVGGDGFLAILIYKETS
jgi:hypothetical protein